MSGTDTWWLEGEGIEAYERMEVGGSLFTNFMIIDSSSSYKRYI